MKFSVFSLLIATTLGVTSAAQNQACNANYEPYAGPDNVVIVTEYLTVTAGANRPVPSIKPTTIQSNGKIVIADVKTVTAGSSKNEAPAGNGVVTPASQAPAASSKPAEKPAAQNSPAAPAPAAPSPTAAASVPAKAPSPAPPAASPPAQSVPAVSQAPQPTSGNNAGSGSSNNNSGGGGSFTGDGTFFSPGLGSCGLTNSDSDLIAAIPAPQYGSNPNPNNAEVCGKCALVKGPKGQVKVKITDRCPVCKTGDLDLSPSAFQQIGDFDAGRIPISWSFVAC
ncbi:hypothetical protein IWW37_005720 [Coemansia sp. RSA 2050]|nr:hypothetical protein IWW37_005720 [Coemansia sp. RSA 2050]KAJ2729279.1 hypothetical protein IW152_005683 [Coemansia sp. BCRC 34962]